MQKNQNFKTVKTLGKGAFGKVYHVQNEVGMDFAMKKLKLSDEREKQLAISEAKVLFKLNHPNIIRFQQVFEDQEGVSILMELAEGGSLQDKLNQAAKDGKPIDMKLILKWALQTINALGYLHDHHFIHRDIKPANILLNEDGDCKLADLGIARLVDGTMGQANTFAGTKMYMSPEVFREDPYNNKTDIWSFGILMYQLCTFTFPFNKIGDVLAGNLKALPEGFPPVMREIVKLCLIPEPERRTDAKTLKKMIKAYQNDPSTFGTYQAKLTEKMLANDMDTVKLSDTDSTVRSYQSTDDSSYSVINLDSGVKFPPMPKFNLKAKLEGHTGSCFKVIQLKDGKLASSSGDTLIHIWNIPGKNIVRTLKGHTDKIWALVQLQDGRLASGSNDKTIRIWNLSTGACEIILNGHTSYINCLLQLPNGKLVSGGFDHMIKIWNIGTASCERTLKHHNNSVNGLFCFSDGMVGSASGDKLVKIWSPTSDGIDSELSGHTEFVWCVTQLSDGTLATGSHDGTIKIWDYKTKACLKTLKGHNDTIYNIHQLSKNTLISCSWDGNIKVWDLDSNTCTRTIKEGQGIPSMTLLEGGGFATAALDKLVKLYE